MDAREFNVSNNLALMKELLCCGTKIDLWHYSSDGHLVETTSDHLVLDIFFNRDGNKEYVFDHKEEYTAPLIIGGQMGLMWCAVYRKTGNQLHSVYVLGPVINSEISTDTIENSVRTHNIDLAWREKYIQIMQGLPVVSSVLFFQYALMVHYCVTGEKLSRNNLHFKKWSKRSGNTKVEPHKDRMQVWYAERALLNMVREGDLNYQKALSKASLLSGGIRSGEESPLLQAIVSTTGFTTLCVREAIQAGLSPETAYSVGDSYIQSMVQCKNISELVSINHAMYEDFIIRVHKHRTNPKLSSQIAACRDYIELHTDEPLTLGILAKRIGYSEPHLSRKFKEEMGVSVTAYIRYARVEQAKLLLATTQNSVAQIAASLHFCSSSHFSQSFLDVVGMKPQQYRQKNQKL